MSDGNKHKSKKKNTNTRKETPYVCVVMLTLLFAVAICYCYGRVYLPFQEHRPDAIRLNDKLLACYPIADMSHTICGMITLVPAVTVVHLWSERGFYAVEQLWLKYAFANVVKALTLYLTPLEVPENYIPLVDKISSHFTNSHQTYGRDLFFSGHTALMYLCAVSCTDFTLAVVIYVCMFVMANMLMINRVHYTIDMVIAPFVGYACHRFVEMYT